MSKRIKISLTISLATICLISCFVVGNMYARFMLKNNDHVFSLGILARYKLLFDANGGEINPDSLDDSFAIKTTSAAIKFLETGKEYGALPVTSRKGYTFDGWTSIPNSEILPDGYQRVEYIESKGNAYIDTGIILSENDFSYEFDYERGNNSKIGTIIGNQWDYSMFYGVSASVETSWFQLNGSNFSVDEGRHKYVFSYSSSADDNYRRSLKQDDIEIRTGNKKYTSHSNKPTVKIFANTGYIPGDNGRGRIYSVKISNPHLLGDYVPVVWKGGETTYSKNNNEITGFLNEGTSGLYDKVSGIFYINSYSNDNFSVGKVVDTMEFVGKGKVTSSTAMSTPEDCVIFAYWHPNVYTLTLNYCDDITPNSTCSAIFDETYSLLPLPERKGYNFAGWFDSNGILFKKNDKVQITENTTLNACWSAEEYTVTLDPINGDAVTSMNVTFGEPYGDLPEPTREGYVFTGWVSSPLPAGYQQIDYVESKGNSYIDTRILLGANDFSYDFDYAKPDSSAIECIIGNQHSNCMLYGATNSGFIYNYCGLNSNLNITDTQRHNYVYSYTAEGKIRSLTQDSKDPITATNAFSPNKETILIFNNNGYTGDEGRGKIYSVKIHNPELVRDYIPAVWQGGETSYYKGASLITGELSAGTPGLYDMVSGVFFVSYGSADFTAGSAINEGAAVTASSPVAIARDHVLIAQWDPIETDTKTQE